MRLINTHTGLIEDFVGDDIPEYAILSHTWEKDEISLQEFQYCTDPDFADDPKTARGKAKAGFLKIKGCVELAASQGISYVWVDTCCIDKTSSADLTESINSMYRWYASSKVCFAYLVDVEHAYGLDEPPAWQNSRWFSRGWTLQELIAPSDVKFYSNSWDYLGSRESWSRMLSDLTGIPERVLKTNDLSKASVAQKMSWASNRKTTRKEDMAYCLLGLFDINMPLLYGEGEKAFLRLQEHIAASSTDHSLFAWGVRNGSPGETGDNIRSYRSIFARSPENFAECGDLVENILVPPESWTQTNRGFHAILPTLSYAEAKELLYLPTEGDRFPTYIDDTDYLVLLNCWSKGHLSNRRTICGFWISMIEVRDDGKHGFCRVTDTTTLRPVSRVDPLRRSLPNQYLKDMWLATTSRTLQIPRNYFSKRLRGFLVPEPKVPYNGVFKIHSLYESQTSIRGNVLPCPLLPLNTKGGFVGAATIEVQIPGRGPSHHIGYAALVVFGFPPSLTKPFSNIFGYCVEQGDRNSDRKHDFDSDLLGHGLQRYAELEHGGFRNENSSYYSSYFAIHLSRCTVLYEGMVFTQLGFSIDVL
jgi:hypothetical protein